MTVKFLRPGFFNFLDELVYVDESHLDPPTDRTPSKGEVVASVVEVPPVQ